ncbi:Na+/H+ antiporter subunit E [Ignavibacteriales bacterium]
MMGKLSLNITLAVVWMFLSGSFGFLALIEGAVVGFGVIFLLEGVIGAHNYTRKLFKIINLFFFFLWELLVSNYRVAIELLTPRFISEPAIVAVPLSLKTDLQITLLANLVTLTPGTLSIDVSDDKKFLFVHLMYGGDPDKAIADIKSGFERRIMEVFE